jgi:hypothetical protein
MRRLFLVAATIFSLGSETCLAQIAAMPNVTLPPSSTQAPTLPAPASSSRPAGTAGNALGSLSLNLGSPIGTSTPGAIQTCPTAETAGASADIPVDATDATTNSTPGFGTSAMSGNCIAGSPASSPGIIPTSEFSDGAVPLSTTEAGGLGLSPLIAVPYTAAPSAACPASPTPYVGTGTMTTPSVPAC